MGVSFIRMMLLIALLTATAAAQGQQPPPFSKSGPLDKGWEPLEFPNISRKTQYRLVTDTDGRVLRAEANGSASGLITRLNIEPGDSLLLKWRWKVSNVYKKGDATQKSGDDYPARIYVAFEYEPEKTSFFDRVKRKAVSVFADGELPGSALNYIWANRLPEGEIVTNPFSDETRMLAVDSGAEQAGKWISHERDIVADYREAFGTAPPAIVGIGVMSDADNTGEQATAWFGDIQLIRSAQADNQAASD